MHNIKLMEVIDSIDDLMEESASLLLRESLLVIKSTFSYQQYDQRVPHPDNTP